MSRIARTLCAAAAACLLAAAPAAAKVHHVHEGGSIQDALGDAEAGDTVLVHRGTYRESLQIDKDRVRLRGKRARLLPPNEPADTLCNRFEPVTGICVAGELDLDPEEMEPPRLLDFVTGVRITGFTIEGFSANGILGVGSERLRVSHVKLVDDGGYGVFTLLSRSPRLTHSLATGNEEAGFYVGDSPEVNAVVSHNRASDNGQGVLLRDATGGRVSHNKLSGNCAGVLVLADAPGPTGGFRIDHNRVSANNKVCPGEEPEGEPGEEPEGEPGLSGLGIGLVGAFGTRVTHNRVFDNQLKEGVESFVSGGIAVVRGPEGTPPENDVVRHNKAFGNLPTDLLWDGTGTVLFKKNKCDSSAPEGLCATGGGGKAHNKQAKSRGKRG